MAERTEVGGGIPGTSNSQLLPIVRASIESSTQPNGDSWVVNFYLVVIRLRAGGEGPALFTVKDGGKPFGSAGLTGVGR